MISSSLFNFDCTGFYVKRNAISQTNIEAINSLWEKDTTIVEYQNVKRKISLEPIHIETLLHQSVHEICRACFTETYHLDHLVIVQQEAHSEKRKINLHGLSYGKSQSHYYISYLQRHIKTPCITAVGQLSVGVVLKGQDKSTGGLCYVPGSHKTSYNISGQELVQALYKKEEDYQDVLIVPTLYPGDIVAFPENLLHGNTRMEKNSLRRMLYGMFFPTSIRFKTKVQELEELREKISPDLQKYILHGSESDMLSKNFNTRPIVRPLHTWS